MSIARTFVTAAVLFGFSASASAVVFGPTNFDFMGYDEADCYEPSLPYSADEYAIRSLRTNVEIYLACMNEYVEAGNKDIERIGEAQEDAQDDADAFINRLDRWIATRR